MTKYYLRLLALLTVFSSCKKDKQEGDKPVKKWVVTTVAGDGNAGLLNGAASTAQFHSPTDVVVAADGSLYITDADNHRIRKISGEQVSTFAGGDSGIVNGNGSSARFLYPNRITAGTNGSLIISDYVDPRIRKINGAAEVTTYAGSNLSWFADGNLASALFTIGISGIASDALGNVYVADTYNMRIRSISVSGNVSTIAGSDTAGSRNGKGASAQFYYPGGITIDRQGILYVTEPYRFRIRKITQDGTVSNFAGSGSFGHTDADANTARFEFPVDVITDSQQNVYVLDNNCIRRISAQGIVSTIAGGPAGYADGEGSKAKFNSPAGLGIDIHDNIYVADFGNNRIRKISFQ